MFDTEVKVEEELSIEGKYGSGEIHIDIYGECNQQQSFPFWFTAIARIGEVCTQVTDSVIGALFDDEFESQESLEPEYSEHIASFTIK
ncbi:hypothetical protein HCG51_08885 [Tolypothrix sp. PCC 7910]|uniref:hypothetical protein n=1 Tax=Tolypothrix sp. PCC 7910 TaxID=2099387 RepID=UPI0014278D61|nr:hypothetical protein [Tolypothrix sp. PCC 7910]QIR36845.1 hypothetical protein HCG51_08885 [Tolypothrix sp. PCC 7910]